MVLSIIKMQTSWQDGRLVCLYLILLQAVIFVVIALKVLPIFPVKDKKLFNAIDAYNVLFKMC